MRYEFITETREPVSVNGVSYKVYTIKSKDCLPGGFYHDLSAEFNRKRWDFNIRLAQNEKRFNDFMAGGATDWAALDDVDLLRSGALLPIQIDYQRSLIAHYTDIPPGIIDDLPMTLLEKLAAYIESGEMPLTDDEKNAVTAAIVPDQMKGQPAQQEDRPPVPAQAQREQAGQTAPPPGNVTPETQPSPVRFDQR